MIHELKTDPGPFDDICQGFKTFELRKADRPFRKFDVLHLRKTILKGSEMAAGGPLKYGGPECLVRVLGIMAGPVYGLEAGWVILSIRMLEQDWKPIHPDRIKWHNGGAGGAAEPGGK